MIQTRYLVVAIVICLVLIVQAGIFTEPKKHTPRIQTPSETVVFGMPRDSYTVVSPPRDVSHRRDDLIMKVRESLAQDPIKETTAPIVLDEPVEDAEPEVPILPVPPPIPITTPSLSPTATPTPEEIVTEPIIEQAPN